MIRLSDVVKEYESGTTALKGISLRIEDGEFVFLVGPSGSGKSTIIKLLTGEIVPTSGQIAVNGFSLTNIAERQIPLLRRSVGVIFQDFRLIEKKTVYENLGFAMRAVGSSPREIKKRIPYVLELVGLEEKTDRYPNELSGGEQQRVAIARALINNPSTIIADEPTGNLDPARSLEIMRLLERINQLGTTMVVVTHEKDLVNQFKKRVVTLGFSVPPVSTTPAIKSWPCCTLVPGRTLFSPSSARTLVIRPGFAAMTFVGSLSFTRSGARTRSRTCT